MTTFYSAETAGTLDGTLPGQLADAASIRGKVHTIFATFNLANQAPLQIGDQIVIGRLHTAMRVRNTRIVATVSLGAATLGIGSTTATGKYATPATYTTPNVPQDAMLATSMGVALTASESLVATVGAAALPAAGILVIAVDLVLPHSN